jgi:hypothetical protein
MRGTVQRDVRNGFPKWLTWPVHWNGLRRPSLRFGSAEEIDEEAVGAGDAFG